jgi:hypothetical protein
MCVCVFVSIRDCAHLHAHVQEVVTAVCAYVSECSLKCAPASRGVHVSVCLYRGVRVSVSLSIQVSCVCLSLYTCVRAYVCVRLLLNASVHDCAYVCVCVCM